MKKLFARVGASLISLALVSAAYMAFAQQSYQVISPFGPFQLLSAAQGGTQMDGSVATANNVLVTTGNPQAPYTYQPYSAGGGGTVTSVSVTPGNGLTGSVTNPTTTPAISLGTTITGVLKGNGTAISAAVSGTDYAPATSGSALLYGNGAGGFSNATPGTCISFSAGTLTGTCQVSTVSVVSANGMGGSVATATTTPAITLTTSVNGLAKGNGTGFSTAVSGTDYAPATSGSAILKGNAAGGFASAVSGTDYAPATSGSSILYGNGAGGFSNATIGSGLSFSAGTLSASGIGSNTPVATTSQYNATSNTTLTNVPGMSVTLVAGATYLFEIHAYLNSGANSAGGVQYLLSGTATATSFVSQTVAWGGTGANITTGGAQQVSFPTTALNVAAGTATAMVMINGTITVNAGGTLTFQFAQQTSNATASSVLVGSTMNFVRVS